MTLSRPGRDKRYGFLNAQTLRPCVAAYRTCEPLAIVSPATSTAGSPAPATTQVDDPLGSLSTPKSVPAKRSPLFERARAVTGRSPIGPVPPSRSFHVALLVPGV